ERPSVELELITVLANLVSIKHRERLSLDSVQISVRNDRTRQVVCVRRELLRKLNDPLVGFWIANLANAEARSRYVVVSDLQVMIGACQSFRQIPQQITPLALDARVLAFRDDDVLVG